MNNQDVKKEPEVKDVEVAQKDEPVAAPQQTITMGVDQFKEFIQATVENVLKASKTERVREQAEEYNNRISEAVQSSQATLIKPAMAQGESNVEYVRKVLEQDVQERHRNSDGKTYYSDKGEDFVKAKIIILKKMGLTDEEIAKSLFEN